MSDIRKLIAGIVLVLVALFMVLNQSSVMAIIGAVLGLTGAVLVVRTLIRGDIK